MYQSFFPLFSSDKPASKQYIITKQMMVVFFSMVFFHLLAKIRCNVDLLLFNDSQTTVDRKSKREGTQSRGEKD